MLVRAPSRAAYELPLADGSRWHLTAGHGAAAPILALFASAASLQPAQTAGHGMMVWAGTEADLPAVTDSLHCTLRRAVEAEHLAVEAMRLGLTLGQQFQARGALLLHAALVSRDGWGLALAGPGGRGKSTAAERIPAPWRTLCDDTCLIVPDAAGTVWAHPWPTWSRFMFGRSGGRWDVPSAVRLGGVCFLAQGRHDSLAPLGQGQAACLLAASAEQMAWHLVSGRQGPGQRADRLRRFANACRLAADLPCHVLHVTQHGRFWDHLPQPFVAPEREAA